MYTSDGGVEHKLNETAYKLKCHKYILELLEDISDLEGGDIKGVEIEIKTTIPNKSMVIKTTA